MTTTRWTTALVALAATLPALGAAPRKEFRFGVEMARDAIWREAAFRWIKVAEKVPDNPHVLNNLGVAYEKLGEYDLALATYRRALELAPDDQWIRANHDQFQRFYEEFVADREGDGEASDGR